MSETKSPLGGLTRRGFLKTTGAVTAVAAVAGTGAALAPMPPLVPPPARLLTPPLVPSMASRRSGAHAAATAVAAAPWR